MLKSIPLIFCLLLVSCSPFRVATPPEIQLPQAYLAEAQTAAATLPERWWESFNDAELNRLQAQLFGGNLDLQQAIFRLEQLEALQRLSRASLWPTLTLSGSFNREKSGGSNSAASIANNQRASLAASYEIDLWNRLHDRSTAAELRLTAAQLETQSLLLTLSAQLAEQYFVAAEQRAQLELVEGQIGHYQELITTISNRYRSGIATARELYQARQNLARAEALLPQYRTGIVRAENSIALLLGELPQAQITLVNDLPEISSAVAAGLPASLLPQRPDVAAALAGLRATDRDLAAALAERLPSINLSATAFYSATQLARGDIDGTFWTLALGLTQPLIDGGRRQAESDRQRALRDEALATYKKAILTAVQEVETALVADHNSAIRQQSIQRQLEASHQELISSHDNYRRGLLSSQDLLVTEVRYLETASQQIAAQRQWLSNRITLARALGGDWMPAELSQQIRTLNEKRNSHNGQ